MVIFLPLFMILLVLGALRGGGSHIAVLLPTLVLLGAGAAVMNIAMRDGRRKKDPRVSVLPDNRLSRQMRATLRPHHRARPVAPSQDVTPLRSAGHPRWARPRKPPPSDPPPESDGDGHQAS